MPLLNQKYYEELSLPSWVLREAKNSYAPIGLDIYQKLGRNSPVMPMGLWSLSLAAIMKGILDRPIREAVGYKAIICESTTRFWKDSSLYQLVTSMKITAIAVMDLNLILLQLHLQIKRDKV